jgi:hypothetical protein
VENALEPILSGVLGSFVELDRMVVPDLEEASDRPGFIRVVDGNIEVQLLRESPGPPRKARRLGGPVAIVGATPGGGAVVLDVTRWGRRTNYGGSRVSIDYACADTLIAGVNVFQLTSVRITKVAARFLGEAVLKWVGVDAYETEISYDDSTRAPTAVITLLPPRAESVPLLRSRRLEVMSSWSLQATGERGPAIDTGAEIAVSAAKPVAAAALLTPLLRLKELMGFAFNGAPSPPLSVSVMCDGPMRRASLWNSELMRTEPTRDSVERGLHPLFTVSDLGGVRGLSRWVALCERHPRAISPMRNVHRGLTSTYPVMLMQVAAALEYWAAANARSAAWARIRPPAEAVARRLGTRASLWLGDVAKWADALTVYNNKLKHDPKYAVDPQDLRTLCESAYLVLAAALLCRAAESQAPATVLLSDYRFHRLGEQVRHLAGNWVRPAKWT